MNTERLLELADILDRADADHDAKGEPRYKQYVYTHECNTPACALGHWAAAHPERWTLNPRSEYESEPKLLDSPYTTPFQDARHEFDLTRGDVDELFSWDGCGAALSASEAAAYIRAFVGRKAQ